MKLLTLFVLSAGLVVLAPMAAMADSYDGCIDFDVSIGYGILTMSGAEVSCTACGGGDTYSYVIKVYEDCSGGYKDDAHFCTLDPNIPLNTWFFVQSIGGGCTGDPQGCVRITPCPE